MSITNPIKAKVMELQWPHTFVALQHLVMAMADYQDARYKRSFLGTPKGPAAYTKMERALAATMHAMVKDGSLSGAHPGVFRTLLIERIESFAEAFPNWRDAYAYAHEFLTVERKTAEERIAALLAAMYR